MSLKQYPFKSFHVFIIFIACHSFMDFWASIWFHFPSVWKTLFRVSFTASLLALNFFSFPLSENIFVVPPLLKNVFFGGCILFRQIFSLYFEAISAVSSVVSVKKSPAVYSDPVRLISFCPCCSCKILFYFILVFNLLKLCTFFTKNYTACGSQCFLSHS